MPITVAPVIDDRLLLLEPGDRAVRLAQVELHDGRVEVRDEQERGQEDGLEHRAGQEGQAVVPLVALDVSERGLKLFAKEVLPVVKSWKSAKAEKAAA